MRLILFLLAFSLTHAAQASTAAIASAHPLATEAGFDILEQGGNAFDAAVAVAAALSVVEPTGSGMGGGGFWLLHRQQDGFQTMVDARETAPAGAYREMYLDHEGNVERDWAINGPSAAAIPGQAAAFAHVAERYGTLPLADLLAPAIRMAEEGFPVDERYRRLAGFRQDAMQRFPETRRIFLLDGAIPPQGHRLIQPDLARVLKAVAEHGHDGFYRGEVAEQLVNGVQEYGGLWTLEDLENYQIIEREPVVGTFRGATITSASLPSSGGIVLMQTLNILSRFNDGNLDPSVAPHIIAEALRRAYRDRAEFLGDPDFADVPVERLLSRSHAGALAASIRLDQPTASEGLGKLMEQPSGTDTTHFSIIDAQGNRVAATLSINLPFGSAFVPPGTGVLLNNEMDDFSAKPGEPNAYGLVGSDANAIEPGKRPLSSMTPTFLDWDGNSAVLGTPGGSRIISMVMLAILDALDGHDVDHWVSRPRFHHQYLPDLVEGEPDFIGSEDARRLMVRGHELKSTGRRYGNMQVIKRDGNGTLSAAADPRGVGEAWVRELEPK